MLQVIRIGAGFALLLLLAGPARAATFQWVLEEALQDEYVPLFQPDIVGPAELVKAIEAYHRGDYRTALYFLERSQKLRLPDGALDFVMFVAAESYRMIGLKPQALENYRYVCRRFEQSDKVPPSLFRCIEYAYADREFDLADSLFAVFHSRYASHPLATTVFYTMGKAYYRSGRYSDASAILERIPHASVRYVQAQFLHAMSRCGLQEWDKALLLLEYVRTQGRDKALVREAIITIGDVYLVQGNHAAALKFYSAARLTWPRYQYVLVKRAMALLGKSDARGARNIARDFLARYPKSDYYFDMASVLEQAYDMLGDRANKVKAGGRIVQELAGFRMSYEVNEERDRLAAVVRGWESVVDGDPGARSEADSAISRARIIERQLDQIVNSLDINSRQRRGVSVSGLAERRYLMLMRDSVNILSDSIQQSERGFEQARRIAAAEPADSNANRAILATVQAQLDTLKRRRTHYENEYSLVIEECFGDRLDSERRVEEERQAQFVDWTFRKYVQKKDELVELNARMTRSTSDSAADSSKTAMDGAFAAAAYAKLEKSIEADRRRLVNLIESMVDLSPGGVYNPALLLRLAECYFDQASDEFAVKLREYERRMAEGASQDSLEFPTISHSRSIAIYGRIARDFPRSELADVALFYQALSLQKEQRDEDANRALLALIQKYPESPFFVEANMNIGRYYFEHPGAEESKGYVLAEEAFRRVLYHRDHPQFVQALYHLGWCYYMQDQFDEAIAVFRYLVEEVDLDFSKTRMEDNQVANPLLREEAIDYIAVAFDERGSLEETVRFLRLIGSFDYSSVVLKRIGELREEVQDWTAALAAYQVVESEYPITIAAPDAALNEIRIYEALKQPDSALVRRERFLPRFCAGSEWQKAYAQSDRATVARIDSIALAVGLFTADAMYRKASDGGVSADYERAARAYLAVVKAYQQHPKAYDARWNLAVILETKLLEKKAAFENYLQFSQLSGADSSRREQAALNAVAIAQQLLPPDSALAPGAMETASVKLVEAVDNYVKQFPQGSARGTVLLAQASVFFNRKMFASAQKLYLEIIALGPQTKEYYEATHLLAQSYFQEEKWDEAAAAFTKVALSDSDESRRKQARTLLLQSRYFVARKLLAAEKYPEAVTAMLAIEQDFPGSEYGDIVMYGACEAYEKQGKFEEAGKLYAELVRKYPLSKYASDALFNAATAYEKENEFKSAVEIYERLVSEYPESPKAKDGLFNLALCYEKLGKTDKVAESQERYSRLYPGEKDVEAMLMRSGEFYLKAGLNEKALAMFRTYAARFPRNDRVVEAVYKAGRAYEAMSDEQNARLQYDAAQKLDRQLVDAGSAGNSYYAAEGAYSLARMQERTFLAVRLTLPVRTLKQQQQRKAELLTEVAAAYQHVIEYQSERMFEAACRIGMLYDSTAQAWLAQDREKLDPLKQAVFEKDLYALAASLTRKAFIPYAKTIEIASKFDSLGIEQKYWVDEARKSLSGAYGRTGEYLGKSALAMLSAPVPKNIEQRPVHHYQYLRQLYETVEPLRLQVRDYYLEAYRALQSQKLSPEAVTACRENFCRLNFAVGSDWSELASQILAKAGDLPKNLDEVEREDIIFQLEDIVTEVQDKAIFALEDAKGIAEGASVTDAVWYPKIVQVLAKLDPDKYGRAYFVAGVVGTDEDWAMRADSVGGWNRADGPAEGWREGAVVRRDSELGRIPAGAPQALARPDNPSAGFYMRRHVFIAGQPRSAALYVASSAPYLLYVNGTLTLSDTLRTRDATRVDSASGITALLKGGDNVIAAVTRGRDSAVCMFAAALTALVDTTRKFESRAPALVLVGKESRTRDVPSADIVRAASQNMSQRRKTTESSGQQAPSPQAQSSVAPASPASSVTPTPSTAPDTAAASVSASRHPSSRIVVNLKARFAQGSLKRLNRRIAKEELAIQRLKTALSSKGTSSPAPKVPQGDAGGKDSR